MNVFLIVYGIVGEQSKLKLVASTISFEPALDKWITHARHTKCQNAFVEQIRHACNLHPGNKHVHSKVIRSGLGATLPVQRKNYNKAFTAKSVFVPTSLNAFG